MTASHSAFLRELDEQLAASPPDHVAVLQRLCTAMDCAVGTLHLLDADGMLQLVVQLGVPPMLHDKIARIPVGKGMAGIAAERRQPVQVCNLQTDTSGVARPGAKLTRMEGSIACPMLHRGELRGVLGVAKPVPYEFTAAEQAFLLDVGSRIAASTAAPLAPAPRRAEDARMPRSLQDTFAPQNACFGCGPANAHGLRLQSFVQGDEVVCTWQGHPVHEAFPGVLAGGIVGTLLDCHCNWAAAWHLMQAAGLPTPPCTVTAEYTVKLRRPTPIHAPLRLRARLVETTNDRARITATLEANGRICATCDGLFVAVKEGHPAFHRW